MEGTNFSATGATAAAVADDETAKLQEMQKQVDQDMNMAGVASDIDMRSIFVGNVDYGATPEEIQTHFQACGTINRVTVLCDKYTGHPKGFAYVEFAEAEAVNNAVTLNESYFRGRLLKVTPKRTNVPGLSVRGRPRMRGYPPPYGYPAYQGGYQPRYRPRPRFGGPGGPRRGGYHPYY